MFTFRLWTPTPNTNNAAWAKLMAEDVQEYEERGWELSQACSMLKVHCRDRDMVIGEADPKSRVLCEYMRNNASLATPTFKSTSSSSLEATYNAAKGSRPASTCSCRRARTAEASIIAQCQQHCQHSLLLYTAV